MRILHTADWHLGASTGPAPRYDEQAWFLDWLLALLAERAIDALVIAGDVFESMHPPADAQALYFRFLARVGGTGVRDVVVVGGNHDSRSGLDAPRAILEAVDVHVVGGMPAADDRLDRMVAPLRARGSEDVAAVCLAVPYVHEYRLGIRTTDLDRDQTRAAFQQAFSQLYADVADHAQERYPGLPLVATGHLTLGVGARLEDAPQAIHQVGTIEGLPIEVLDPRIRYGALGHIHRCYPIAGSTAWYSGTPIAYSLTEMAVKRRVLVVDLDGDAPAQVEPVEVPRGRDLVQLTGPPEAVLTDLAALRWSTRLPPLVYIRVETQLAEPGLIRRLHEAIATHAERGLPVLVEVLQCAAVLELDAAAAGVPPLDDLTPQDVFALMCDARQLLGEERQQLEAAFGAIAAASPEVMDEMVEAIELPPSAKGDAP